MTTSSPTSARRTDALAALDQASEPDPGNAPGAVRALEPVGIGIATPHRPADRVRLLEQAVRTLDAAAEAGDVDLAQTCRSVLESLRARGAMAYARASTGTDAELSRLPRPSRVPLAPPGWARGSILEDGGIVHELVSPLHPTVKVGAVNGSQAMPTDASLSVTDLLIDGRWVRTEPTVQIEGGSYDLDGVRMLHNALQQFVATVDASHFDATP